MQQNNPNIVNSMNPHFQNSRNPLRKISKAVMSFSGDNILLVEGKTDKKLYKDHIIKALGKNIEVLPVYANGLYLDNDDIELISQNTSHTTPGDVHAKLSIILLVKRCYAREWAKGIRKKGEEEPKEALCNKFYGIVDKDFFFDDEMQSLNDSILTYSTQMSAEDWGAYVFDAVSNGRLVTTDTNDVETLIFKFDFDAVKKACKFAASTNNLDTLKDVALAQACKDGYEKYIWEENRNNGSVYTREFLEPEPKSLPGIDWKYCKGHKLVEIFHNLVDMKRTHFINDDSLINAVITNIDVAHFSNTKVYNFIDSI